MHTVWLCIWFGYLVLRMPRYLSNFKAIRSLWQPISRFRGFTKLVSKTSYRFMNKSPGVIPNHNQVQWRETVSIGFQVTYWTFCEANVWRLLYLCCCPVVCISMLRKTSRKWKWPKCVKVWTSWIYYTLMVNSLRSRLNFRSFISRLKLRKVLKAHIVKWHHFILIANCHRFIIGLSDSR